MINKTVEVLRKSLLELIDESEFPIAHFAREIGVSQHTLLFFIYNQRVTGRITMNKINKYIKALEVSSPVDEID
jgi:hypothetical protein